MIRPLAVVAVLALLGGCQRASTQLDAAEDVRAFLESVRTTDRAAFDQHVDRAALKADLLRQAGVRAAKGDPAAALLQTRQGEQLLERLITPETFAFAARSTPALADRTPSTPEIAAVLKLVDEDRVCLPSGGLDGPCAATFGRQGETWRLIGINADGLGIQNLPFPAQAAG